MILYLVGSLRNPDVPRVGEAIRSLGHEVFDDWHAAGPHADDEWKRYETERGHDYRQGLEGWAARHVFSFDFTHLNRASGGVLLLPAGRSGHLELGYLIGQGKPGFVLLDNPDRWDVMYQFCNLNGGSICFTEDELLDRLRDKVEDGRS